MNSMVTVLKLFHSLIISVLVKKDSVSILFELTSYLHGEISLVQCPDGDI